MRYCVIQRPTAAVIFEANYKFQCELFIDKCILPIQELEIIDTAPTEVVAILHTEIPDERSRCIRCKRLLPDGDTGECVNCEDEGNGYD